MKNGKAQDGETKEVMAPRSQIYTLLSNPEDEGGRKAQRLVRAEKFEASGPENEQETRT